MFYVGQHIYRPTAIKFKEKELQKSVIDTTLKILRIVS